jgi:hypothetical protein
LRAIANARRTATARRIALFIAQVLGQLSPERTLDQGLLELLEQPVVTSQVFRLFIVSY